MTMKTKETATGVLQCMDQVPTASHIDVVGATDYAEALGWLRWRVCLHKETGDRLQEMLMAFGPGYSRPSVHDTDESLHVLEGNADYVFFDEAGHPTTVIPLESRGRGGRFYCRVPAGQPHSLVVRSNRLVALQTATGPFRKEGTSYPAWSPENRKAGERLFMSLPPPVALFAVPVAARSAEVMEYASPVKCAGDGELNALKNAVASSPRARVRLCCHPSDKAALHEMFVVYTGSTYVRPNKHVGKDESLHVLEGELDFHFLGDDGEVQQSFKLGSYGSGLPFYLRVPAGRCHTVVMRSPVTVLREATPGPFRREDTLWAPWAPEVGDEDGAKEFMVTLPEVPL